MALLQLSGHRECGNADNGLHFKPGASAYFLILEEIGTVDAHFRAFRSDHESDSTPRAHDFGPFQAVQARGALFPLPLHPSSAESGGRPGFSRLPSGVQSGVEQDFRSDGSGRAGVVAVVKQASVVDNGSGVLAGVEGRGMAGGGGAEEG